MKRRAFITLLGGAARSACRKFMGGR